ncbi:MAG: sugar ABC transporter permease, partial [Anaerolineae bacterium]|nr:sugar ABC transporter permease [Anaerolineae bacterium]
MRSRWLSPDRFFLVVILVPLLLLVAALIYYPAVSTFQTSLTNQNLRINRPIEQIGLENYSRLLGDDEFWEVLGRSLLVVALILPMETIIAFAAALLLNEKFPGRGLVRSLAIIPWMVPPVVNGFLWGWLLNGEYGAFNGLLYQFGLIQDYQYWLREPSTQIVWVAIVHTWMRFAFPMIVLLA